MHTRCSFARVHAFSGPESRVRGSKQASRGATFACPRGMEENALFEAGRKEDAFLRLRNFGFPDHLRRASIRTMLGP
jgi:hypothetical protein